MRFAGVSAEGFERGRRGKDATLIRGLIEFQIVDEQVALGEVIDLTAKLREQVLVEVELHRLLAGVVGQVIGSDDSGLADEKCVNADGHGRGCS